MSDRDLSPTLRALAEARGLSRACELFPAMVASAAARAARPLGPERLSTTEPALQFDPARFQPTL